MEISTPQQPNTLMPQHVGKFAASRMIARESWNLLKQDKEMLWFPILSAATITTIIVVVGVLYFFFALGGDFSALERDTPVGMSEQTSSGIELIFAFVVYFVSAFVVIFFQAGVVTIAKGRMEGKDLTFRDGYRNALSHIGEIALWSLIAASVGLILRIIAERSKLLGRIVIALVGAAWSIVTFFIVPVLIIENISITDSLKKSALVIKQTWGETLIVNIGVGLYFTFLGLIGVLVFITTILTSNFTVIAIAGLLLLLYLVSLIIISETLSIIFKVVLYEYAKTGVIPQGFSQVAIGSAFKSAS